jgi:hypothetical protein
MRPSVFTSYRRRHKHYSIDQLGLLDVWALKIPSVELVAGKVVAIFQGDICSDWRLRADDHLRDPLDTVYRRTLSSVCIPDPASCRILGNGAAGTP